MTDRAEKSSLVLVAINGTFLLLLGVILAFVFTRMGLELTGEPGREPNAIMAPWHEERAIEESSIEQASIEQAMGELTPDERAGTLDDPALFRDFVRDRVLHLAILTAARDDEALRTDPSLDYRMRRAAERVLVDEYLKRKLDTGISESFPREKQMREFYRENQARYLLDERIHAWQIFFTLPKNAPDEKVRKVTETARALAGKLRAGSIDFSDAAMEYSQHETSRANGGYLGVFYVSQLFPVLKEALMGLDEGRISDPIRSDTGIHILRRGAKIPAQTLSFEQVREKIRAEMRAAAMDDLDERVLDQLYESHGKPVPEPVVEAWRIRMRRKLATDGGEDTDNTENTTEEPVASVTGAGEEE